MTLEARLLRESKLHVYLDKNSNLQENKVPQNTFDNINGAVKESTVKSIKLPVRFHTCIMLLL